MKKNIFLLLLLTSFATMFGQTTTIYVTDSSNSVIKGATVTITKSPSNVVKTTLADGSSGSMSSTTLPAGTYNVTVTSSCYTTLNTTIIVPSTGAYKPQLIMTGTPVVGSITISTLVNGVLTYDPSITMTLTRPATTYSLLIPVYNMTNNLDGTYTATGLNLGNYTYASTSNSCRNAYGSTVEVLCTDQNPTRSPDQNYVLNQGTNSTTVCGGANSVYITNSSGGNFFQNNHYYTVSYNLNGTPGSLSGAQYVQPYLALPIPGIQVGDALVVTSIQDQVGGCAAVSSNLFTSLVLQSATIPTSLSVRCNIKEYRFVTTDPPSIANTRSLQVKYLSGFTFVDKADPGTIIAPVAGSTNNTYYQFDNLIAGHTYVATASETCVQTVQYEIYVSCDGVISSVNGYIAQDVVMGYYNQTTTTVTGTITNNGSNVIDASATATLVAGATTINGVWSVDHFNFLNVPVSSTNSNTYTYTVTSNCYGVKTNTILINCATALEPLVRANVNVDYTGVTSLCQSTSVLPTSCDVTYNNLNSYIYCGIVRYAQNYRWRVTNLNTSDVQTADTPLRQFRVIMLSNFAYNTPYQVEVAVKVGGIWGNYSLPCYFSTGEPTTQMLNCAATPATMGTQNACGIVQFAKGYRFQLTNGEEITTFDNTIRQFSLGQVTGIMPATTYNVRVAVQNTDGSYMAYGPTCQITTPGAAGTATTKFANTSDEMVSSDFNVVSFPNPFANSFAVNVSSISQEKVQIKVYDMVGRLVEQRNANVSELESTQIGNNYQSGIYNVIVSQGENVKTLRVIKR